MAWSFIKRCASEGSWDSPAMPQAVSLLNEVAGRVCEIMCVGSGMSGRVNGSVCGTTLALLYQLHSEDPGDRWSGTGRHVHRASESRQMYTTSTYRN